jgi:hypothetical protein
LPALLVVATALLSILGAETKGDAQRIHERKFSFDRILRPV